MRAPRDRRWIQPDTVLPVDVQGVQAWNWFAYVNNSPVKCVDENGHWIIAHAVLIGAVVGAAIGYGAQVYSNYQNGYSGSEAWTQNIDYKPIVGGALVGAGAVLMAPAAVAAAGNGLVGAGLATGSTTLFSAGTTTLAASSTMGAAIYGGSQIGKLSNDVRINF